MITESVQEKALKGATGWLQGIYSVVKVGSTFTPYLNKDMSKAMEEVIMQELYRIPIPVLSNTSNAMLLLSEVAESSSRFMASAIDYVQLLVGQEKGFVVHHYVANTSASGVPLFQHVPVDVSQSFCTRLSFPVRLTSQDKRQILGMCIVLERRESMICYFRNEYTDISIDFIPGLPKLLSQKK